MAYHKCLSLHVLAWFYHSRLGNGDRQHRESQDIFSSTENTDWMVRTTFASYAIKKLDVRSIMYFIVHSIVTSEEDIIISSKKNVELSIDCFLEIRRQRTS